MFHCCLNGADRKNMNKTLMIARLTKDAEIRYTTGDKQTAVAKFSVACDKEFKRDGEPTANFYNCIAFGKTAETIQKYAGTKGTQLGIEGVFENNNWTDKDGNKHYDFHLRVEKISFTGKRGDNSQSQTSEAPKQDDGFMNVASDVDEELPFQ